MLKVLSLHTDYVTLLSGFYHILSHAINHLEDSFFQDFLSKTCDWRTCSEKSLSQFGGDQTLTYSKIVILHQFFRDTLPIPSSSWGCLQRAVFIQSCLSDLNISQDFRLLYTRSKHESAHLLLPPELKGYIWKMHIAVSVNDDVDNSWVIDPFSPKVLMLSDWEAWLKGHVDGQAVDPSRYEAQSFYDLSSAVTLMKRSRLADFMLSYFELIGGTMDALRKEFEALLAPAITE